MYISGYEVETSEIEGAFYHLDYYSDDYIDDSYGQLCIEERLGDKFDPYKYKQDKSATNR